MSERRALERVWAVRTGDDGDDARDLHLLEALRTDPDLRRALAEDDRIDGVLRALAVARDGAGFVDRTLRALALEEDGGRFTAAVLERLDRQEDARRAPSDARVPARRGWRLRHFGIAAAACAVVAVAFVVGDARRDGERRAVEGGPATASNATRGGASGGAAPSPERLRQLRPGDRLLVAAGAREAGRLGAGTTLTAFGPARVRIAAPDLLGAQVVVDSGAVALDLNDAAASVQLPDLRAIAARGPARFVAEARPEGGHVRVEAGVVHVRGPRGSTAEVRAGQVAIVRFDDLSVRAPVDPAEVARASDTVWSADFDAELDAGLRGGSVTDCPPGRKGGRCIAGTQYDRRFRRSLGVQIIGREDSLFAYDPDLVISFDYWIGAWSGDRAPRLTVGLYAAGGGGLFETVLEPPHPQPARWVTAHVRLSDLTRDDRERLASGRRVRVLRFGTDYAVQDVVYFDNVRVWRPAPR